LAGLFVETIKRRVKYRSTELNVDKLSGDEPDNEDYRVNLN
jgi:hypothetical protein